MISCGIPFLNLGNCPSIMSHIGPSNASSSSFRVSRNSRFPSFHISVHGNIKFDRNNVLFRSPPGSWEHCNQISPCALYLEVQVYEEILILETDDCLLYRDCKKYCSQLHKIRHNLLSDCKGFPNYEAKKNFPRSFHFHCGTGKKYNLHFADLFQQQIYGHYKAL